MVRAALCKHDIQRAGCIRGKSLSLFLWHKHKLASDPPTEGKILATNNRNTTERVVRRHQIRSEWPANKSVSYWRGHVFQEDLLPLRLASHRLCLLRSPECL